MLIFYPLTNWDISWYIPKYCCPETPLGSAGIGSLGLIRPGLYTQPSKPTKQMVIWSDLRIENGPCNGERDVPSGNFTVCYGRSPFWVGKSWKLSNSMGHFYQFVPVVWSPRIASNRLESPRIRGASPLLWLLRSRAEDPGAWKVGDAFQDESTGSFGYMDLTGSYWILLDLTGSYWILLDLTGSYWM